jgi:uncharacterized protein YndB with AHSA1/START domain
MIILISLAFIIAIPLVAAFFLTKVYTIEREVVINKPSPQVFSFVKLIKNSEQYNKWVMTDPNARKSFKGQDGTVGFVYAWDSDDKNVGKGEQEITRIREGERIEYDLRFIKPFEAKAKSAMLVESITAEQTKVRWMFGGERNYLMRIMHFLLNLKKMLGNDLTTSLITLKSVLEK